MIGLLVISTRRYKELVPALLDGVKKYFLPNHNITVFVFNDMFMELNGDERVKICQFPINSYGFPEATLFRFKIFYEHRWQLSLMEYVFYCDCDMKFVDTVGDEILCDGLTVVYHPGYYAKRNLVGHWGSLGVVNESLAWLEPSKRVGYVCGGFNGGKTGPFLEMANILNQRIDEDKTRGVIAQFHDESHLNFYIKKYYLGETLYLDASYCMPEPKQKRFAWGIQELKPKILALEKENNFRQ